MKKILLLTTSHGFTLVIGFALGIYLLPILTAPKTIEPSVLQQTAKNAVYNAELKRDLRGSDFLHWG